MSSSSKKRSERKKRRSSFVRGRSRKSLPPTDISCAELHKRIPTDIPEAKRLYQLQEACFEFTVQKVRMECPAMEGWEEFETEASEAFKNTLDALEQEGILDKACSRKNSYLPNPENKALEKTIAEIRQQTERLTQESEKWEELLRGNTEEAEAAERVLANPEPEKPLLKAPDGLTKDQKKMLSQLPDLGKITTWARQASSKLQLGVDRIHTSSHQMMSFAESSDEYLRKRVELLAKKSIQDTVEDPMELLRRAGGDASSSHSQ
ncbi:kinetochore-associated protein DSN1 homolog [Asterias amurensis]|uniref:kinetochore-associated protein DSN1 homolog n=1 Tax=Asterias amurensis TaxID=7602 RepID=UPI003AB852AB